MRGELSLVHDPAEEVVEREEEEDRRQLEHEAQPVRGVDPEVAADERRQHAEAAHALTDQLVRLDVVAPFPWHAASRNAASSLTASMPSACSSRTIVRPRARGCGSRWPRPRGGCAWRTGSRRRARGEPRGALSEARRRQGVQVAGRLVEEQEGRIGPSSARASDSRAFMPDGFTRRRAGPPRRSRRTSSSSSPCARRPRAGTARPGREEHQVAATAQARSSGALVADHHADGSASRPPRPWPAPRAQHTADRAAVWQDRRPENPQERALARAVRPSNARPPRPAHVEAHAVERGCDGPGPASRRREP